MTAQQRFAQAESRGQISYFHKQEPQEAITVTAITYPDNTEGEEIAMIAWINLAVLIACTLLVLYFEVESAVPATLEKKIGAIASAKCTRARMMASLLMTIAGINYVVYFLYPLPIPLPRTFPWSWWVSAAIASVFAIPAAYLWWREMNEAGKETRLSNKERIFYGDIYEMNRHPRIASELPFWWMIAFLLHSPFLVIFSLIWIPIFEIASWLEQQDLHSQDDEPRNCQKTLTPKQV